MFNKYTFYMSVVMAINNSKQQIQPDGQIGIMIEPMKIENQPK